MSNIIKYHKIIVLLVFLNIFFVVSLFRGENTPTNYFKYKKEVFKKKQVLLSNIKERDRITKIWQLLEQERPDLEILEELLRQNLQFSKPDEILVLSK